MLSKLKSIRARIAVWNDPIRPVWKGDWTYRLSLLADVIGLGNFVIFPQLLYENGGAAFLVAYLFAMLVFGFPLVYLEMALGQRCRQTAPKIFASLVPIASGVGWALVACSLITNLDTTSFLVEKAMLTIYSTTLSEAPWVQCKDPWQKENCMSAVDYQSYHFCARYNDHVYGGVVADLTDDEKSRFNREKCHQRPHRTVCCVLLDDTENRTDELLQNQENALDQFIKYGLYDYESTGIDSGYIHNMGSVRWQSLLMTVLLWLTLYVCIRRSVVTMNTTVPLVVFISYGLLGALTLRVMSLGGGLSEGIGRVFAPDGYPKDGLKLTDWTVWMKALKHVMFSLSLSSGTRMAISSYNPTCNSDCYRDAMMICLADFVSSLFACVLRYGMVGFVSFKLFMDIETADKNSVYLVALYLNSPSSLWMFVYFLFETLIMLGGVIVSTDAIFRAFEDNFKLARIWSTKFRMLACALMIVLCLPATTSIGPRALRELHSHHTEYMYVLLAWLQIMCVVIYGVNRFANDIHKMLPSHSYFGRTVIGPHGYFIQGCWSVVIPVMLPLCYGARLLMKSMASSEEGVDRFWRAKYKDAFFDPNIEWVDGRLRACILPLLIILFALSILTKTFYRRMKQEKQEIQLTKALFRPTADWNRVSAFTPASFYTKPDPNQATTSTSMSTEDLKTTGSSTTEDTTEATEIEKKKVS